jgi:hypothetical protein
MANDTAHLGKLLAQSAFELIDCFMDGLDGLFTVHTTMVGDEHAMRIAPDSDVVDIIQVGDFRGEAAEPVLDRVAVIGICFLALEAAHVHGLDMRVDLRLRAKLLLERRFECRCHVMRFGQPHGAVDFQVETYRHLVGNMLNGEVVNRKGTPLRGEDHLVEHRFIIEGHGMGGNRYVGLRKRPLDESGEPILYISHFVQRQGAADVHIEGDEQRSACPPDAAAPHRQDSVSLGNKFADALHRSLGCRIKERIQRTPAETEPGKADKQ